MARPRQTEPHFTLTDVQDRLAALEAEQREVDEAMQTYSQRLSDLEDKLDRLVKKLAGLIGLGAD